MSKSENLILIGFKSCGKSTIGTALGRALGRPFFDMDSLLEQRHANQTGERLHFRQIFRQYGRDYFRDLEGQVVRSLVGLSQTVISAGGGTFNTHPVPSNLRSTATFVYLSVPPATLWQRIEAGGIPAYFQGDDPHAEFLRLFGEREPIYQRLADRVVDADCSVAEAVGRVLAALNG